MVTFQKDSFTITIPAIGNPAEDWADLMREMGVFFSMLTQENTPRAGFCCMTALLQALVPDYDVACRMTDGAAAAAAGDGAAAGGAKAQKKAAGQFAELPDELLRLREENGRLRECLHRMETEFAGIADGRGGTKTYF